ncbi:MAG: tRNA pseudouridine(54/55) synthase Pus10, partial [Thermoplasmata archaeon]
LHCLGRGFAKLGSGLTNLERGTHIIERLEGKSNGVQRAGAAAEISAPEFESAVSKIIEVSAQIETVEPEACWLCEGLMAEVKNFASILEKQLEGFEFDNFLVGSKVDSELLAREESLWLSAGLAYPESIKAELNREVGKILNTTLGKPTEFSNPEIVAMIDTRFDVGSVIPSPIFIYGRYLKYSRGLPQTKWFCRKCRGRGCEHCNNTGKMYETSVEELIAAPAVLVTEAEDFALHGMGREDIDVLMLGSGRPFVLELTKPKKRRIDFDSLAKSINTKNRGKIEVNGLRKSSRKEMIAIKSSKSKKTYRCRILAKKPIPNEKLKMVVNTFVERVITQRTPIRVSHRRPDKYRKRTVVNCEIVSQNGQEFILDITGESGLYIKELIHGDSARTQPNLSAELGIDCDVIELDVIKIHDDIDNEYRSE